MKQMMHGLGWILVGSGIIACASEPPIGVLDQSPTISGFVESTEQENGETAERNEREDEPASEEKAPSEEADPVLEWSYEADEEIDSGIRIDIEENEEGNLELIVSAVQLESVFGIAFHLNFDPTILEFVSGTSTDILRDNFNQSSSVIRTEEGSIRFGTTRIPPPPQFGGGQDYSGMDLDGAVIARFQMKRLAPGNANLNMPIHNRDVRNSELETLQFSLQAGLLNLSVEEGS